jgi:pyruvate dehydrogenase E1 component
MDHGMRQMLEAQVDEFYYVTVMNENYAQSSMPEGIADQILKGMYRLTSRGAADAAIRVRLLGSGAILREVIAAADLLHQDFDIASDIFSVTSFSEVARDANAIERHNRLHPQRQPRMSHLETCLPGDAPVIAATDYVRAYPQLIASHVRGPYLALGTDGFGRSDTRAALRAFFEVDRHHITVAAISELVREGRLDRSILQSAITRYALDGERSAPWTV